MILEKAREELTPRDVTLLEDILKKDNNSILPGEREMLNARRMYLTDEELSRYSIEKEAEDSAKKSDYASMKFAELKNEAKERGIILEKSAKAADIIDLLTQYDGLEDGDEFQGKIAHRATQEMIDKNGLGDQLEVGDLFFIEKEAEDSAKK